MGAGRRLREGAGGHVAFALYQKVQGSVSTAVGDGDRSIGAHLLPADNLVRAKFVTLAVSGRLLLHLRGQGKPRRVKIQTHASDVYSMTLIEPAWCQALSKRPYMVCTNVYRNDKSKLLLRPWEQPLQQHPLQNAAVDVLPILCTYIGALRASSGSHPRGAE